MNGSRNIKIIVAVIAAAVLCCGAIWYIHSRQSKTYSVPLVINAEGLDTKQGTKIPIHVKGKDVRGNAVNKSFYGGTSSPDIAIKPGKYTFTVSYSPIAKDGTIYNVDGASTDTSISKDGKVSVKSEITISPIAAEKVTDEEIKKACDAAKDSGISTSKLNTLKKKAQTRRDDAVAEKKAASSSGHAYSNDYFYIDVPDDWTSSDWSVEQINSVKWKLYILLYFLIINFIAFLAMGVDKHRAQRQQWRIPEAGLFALVLAGGWIGGIAGMYVFHHKTKKLYFRWGFPAIMILEIVFILVRYIQSEQN